MFCKEIIRIISRQRLFINTRTIHCWSIKFFTRNKEVLRIGLSLYKLPIAFMLIQYLWCIFKWGSVLTHSDNNTIAYSNLSLEIEVFAHREWDYVHAKLHKWGGCDPCSQPRQQVHDGLPGSGSNPHCWWGQRHAMVYVVVHPVATPRLAQRMRPLSEGTVHFLDIYAIKYTYAILCWLVFHLAVKQYFINNSYKILRQINKNLLWNNHYGIILNQTNIELIKNRMPFLQPRLIKCL